MSRGADRVSPTLTRGVWRRLCDRRRTLGERRSTQASIGNSARLTPPCNLVFREPSLLKVVTTAVRSRRAEVMSLTDVQARILCTTPPKGGSRSPQRLGQQAIPLLPQITELLYLVRTLGSTIARFADIFGEIVETGFREIA